MPGKKIEDVIGDVLRGDAQKNALDFVSYLRTNEIPLEESESYWDVKYKGKTVCFLLITGSDEAPGPWTIWSAQEPGSWVAWPDEDGGSAHADILTDERTKEIAWNNVNFCASCGGDCSPGKHKTILGKGFIGVCSSALAFTNPDAEAVRYAKKMVDARISDILESI